MLGSPMSTETSATLSADVTMPVEPRYRTSQRCQRRRGGGLACAAGRARNGGLARSAGRASAAEVPAVVVFPALPEVPAALVMPRCRTCQRRWLFRDTSSAVPPVATSHQGTRSALGRGRRFPPHRRTQKMQCCRQRRLSSPPFCRHLLRRPKRHSGQPSWRQRQCSWRRRPGHPRCPFPRQPRHQKAAVSGRFGMRTGASQAAVRAVTRG